MHHMQILAIKFAHLTTCNKRYSGSNGSSWRCVSVIDVPVIVCSIIFPLHCLIQCPMLSLHGCLSRSIRCISLSFIIGSSLFCATNDPFSVSKYCELYGKMVLWSRISDLCIMSKSEIWLWSRGYASVGIWVVDRVSRIFWSLISDLCSTLKSEICVIRALESEVFIDFEVDVSARNIADLTFVLYAKFWDLGSHLIWVGLTINWLTACVIQDDKSQNIAACTKVRLAIFPPFDKFWCVLRLLKNLSVNQAKSIGTAMLARKNLSSGPIGCAVSHYRFMCFLIT